MKDADVEEMKLALRNIEAKVDNIKLSLKTCQSRCHVDNPSGRWKALGRALLAMVRF